MTSFGTEVERAGPLGSDLEAQAIVVRIADTEFGLPIRSVREVLHVPPITRLPFPARSVPGVASVRGAVLPVVDLGDRLFSAPSSREGRMVIVYERSAGGEVALLVDGVADLIPIDERHPEVPPEIAASLPSGWIEGVVTPSQDRLVTLLNLPSLLARNEEPDEETR